MSSERSFFQAMEEFGFFSHIYEKLPNEFTAVFEIARVLEDETSTLFHQLKEVLKLPAPTGSSRLDELVDFHRYSPAGDEYVADLIHSTHDVGRIYPQQFMLPEDMFLQRLALRELWMPVSKSAQILPVDDVDQGFNFDSRKQKVYILFDTSMSMMSHHRIHLAKAILYYFLKKNKEELGYISLRTFDDKVGEMHTAIDKASYDALMRYALRIHQLGEGTVLQRAIMQALEDFQTMEHLSGAEILIITDGAVTLDLEAIRTKLDENIQIHTIKIGHATIIPSDSQISDMLTMGKHKDQMLVDLMRQEQDTMSRLRNVSGHDKQHAFESTLQGIRQQIKARKAELGGVIQGAFGHEIEQISTVFVNLDDFNETDRFRADEDTIADLEALARTLEEEAKEFLTADLTKKLAILHDHVQFLLRYESDEVLSSRLKEIDLHLKSLLAQFMGQPQDVEPGDNAVTQDQRQSVQLPLGEEDIRDLQFILDADLSGDGSWALILKALWKRAMKKISNWRRK